MPRDDIVHFDFEGVSYCREIKNPNLSDNPLEVDCLACVVKMEKEGIFLARLRSMMNHPSNKEGARIGRSYSLQSLKAPGSVRPPLIPPAKI